MPTSSDAPSRDAPLPPESASRPGILPARWLLAICLIAALTHGLVCMMPTGTAADVEALSNDEKEYVQLGESLARRGELRLADGVAAKRMPVYPALLALLRRSQPADAWLSAAYIVNSWLAFAATILTALIAARIGGRRAALLAGTIAALYAPLLYLELQLFSELPAIVLLLGAIYFCLRADESPAASPGSAAGRRQYAYIAAAGLTLGLAVLTRANLLLAVPACAAHRLVSPGSWRRRAALAGLLTALALTPPALWCQRNSAAIGRFSLSSIGGLNFYLGHNPDFARIGLHGADYDAFDRLRRQDGLSEVQADRALYARGWAFIRAEPWTAAANILRKTVIWMTPTTRPFGPMLYALAFGMLAWHAARLAAKPEGKKRFIVLCTAAIVPALVVLKILFDLSAEAGAPIVLPIVAARDVLILGLPALFLARIPQHSRRLLQWVFISQFLAALAFIPLSRLRWVVDPLLIVALAVAIDRIGSRWRIEDPPAAQ